MPLSIFPFPSPLPLLAWQVPFAAPSLSVFKSPFACSCTRAPQVLRLLRAVDLPLGDAVVARAFLAHAAHRYTVTSRVIIHRFGQSGGGGGGGVEGFLEQLGQNAARWANEEAVAARAGLPRWAARPLARAFELRVLAPIRDAVVGGGGDGAAGLQVLTGYQLTG